MKFKPAYIYLFLLPLILLNACSEDDRDLSEGDVLDNPTAIEYHDGYLYVTNANYDLSKAGEGFLLVIDARKAVSEDQRKNAVVGKRAIEPYLAGMTIDHDREIAYVASRDDNVIRVIDISDPTEPVLIDQDPDADGTQSLRSGKEPYDVALRPDGRYLYSTNVDSGDVSVIDLAAGKLARSISIASDLVSIVVQPGTDYAWVTNRTFNLVSIIDMVKNDFVVSFEAIDPGSSILADTRGIAFTKDGMKAYLAISSPPMVAVVDTRKLPEQPDEAIHDYIPMHSSPYGIGLSPDETECWVTNFESKRVLIVDTRFDAVVDMVRLGSGPADLAFVQFEEDDPEQYYVFVVHFEGHSMSIIDGLTKENLGAIR